MLTCYVNGIFLNIIHHYTQQIIRCIRNIANNLGSTITTYAFNPREVVCTQLKYFHAFSKIKLLLEQKDFPGLLLAADSMMHVYVLPIATTI